MSQLRRHPDGGLDTHWLFHHYADELVASTKTEAEMLAEARSFIRESRLALPTYRHVQDAPRYQMTVEDLGEAEELYRNLSTDTVGIFERQDYADLLVKTTAVIETMSYVMGKAGRGRAQTAQAAAAPKGTGRAVAGLLALLFVFALAGWAFQVATIGWLLGPVVALAGLWLVAKVFWAR